MSSSSSSDDDDEWVLSNISSAEDGCGDNERGEQDGDGQPAVQACKRKVTAIGQGHTSSYRGVRFEYGRWRAEISVKGRLQDLGRFDSEEEAARAFDERAKETRNTPVLNFLPDGSLNPDRKRAIRRHALPDPGRPSTYRGVRFSGGKWKAEISIKGTMNHVGVFDSEEAAAWAYDERAKATRASLVLNILPDSSLNPDRKQRRRTPAATLSRSPSLPHSGRQSIYRGVRFHTGRWTATISVNWQTERLGRFESEEAAARVYDERVKARRDPFVLSFLPNGSLNPDRKKRRRVPAGQQPASAPAAEGNEHAVASEEQAKPNGGGVEAL